MKSSNLLFSGVLFLSVVVQADSANWMQKSFPFKQSMNMEMVYDITTTRPEQLIAKMNKSGVNVLLVKSEKPERELNPLFKNLEVASDELLKKAEVQQSYEGRMISKSNPCCDLKQDTILIRDTALTYTLIHEFMHAILFSESSAGDQDLETQFSVNFRRLTFYQKRIFDDSFELLNPLWRRDMLSAQADVVEKLFARIQMGQSQEAIIEKVLEKYIDSKNQYFDKARQEQGFKYGEVMINNAIDIFNTVEASISFCRTTVANLRAALVAGQIKKSEEPKLDQAAADTYEKSAKTLIERLEAVKTEILLLKEMYKK